MDYSYQSYYKVNELLLSLVGQSPVQSKRSIIIRRFLLNVILVSSFVVQIAKIYIDQFQTDLLLEIIPMLSTITAFLIFALSFYTNFNKFQNLWEQMKDDWESERYDEETKIKESYAKDGLLGTKLLIFFFTCGLIGAMCVLLFYAQILDIIMPQNESHPRQLPFHGGYILDREKYHYIIMIHLDIVLIASILFGVANQSIFWVHMQHVCGMFAVLGYRLQRVIPSNGFLVKNKSALAADNMYYESVSLCIEQHQKALEFTEMLEDYYSPIFVITLLLSVLLISPTLYKMSDVDLIDITAVCQLIVLVGFFFLINYMGQQLIGLSLIISEKAYFSEWNCASVSVQKLFLFIIRRSQKPCCMSAYNLYVMSLDCFRMVMQAGISYYMLLKQLSGK